MPTPRNRAKEDRELISNTLSDLQDSIDELEGRIQFMTNELDAKKQRLEIWRRKLMQLTPGPNSMERQRRPKGENLRAVLACLTGSLNGLAASEIQRRTSLPWSSIQATLKRNPNVFIEGNGLWRLRGVSRSNAIFDEDDIVERDEPYDEIDNQSDDDEPTEVDDKMER